jgi:hypothetical protein
MTWHTWVACNTSRQESSQAFNGLIAILGSTDFVPRPLVNGNRVSGYHRSGDLKYEEP